MTDDELNQLSEKLWRRMEPFAKVELERLFTNYMATRTLLEPELVQKLFVAMNSDMQKFVYQMISSYHEAERLKHQKAQEEYGKWQKALNSGALDPWLKKRR